jgi:uncharacterized protein YbjT (DUF2867 family)
LKKRVILVGASGLVGSAAAPILARAGFDVHAVMRAGTPSVTGVTGHVAAIEQWPGIIAEIGADIAVSCLGTTIRIAGSKAAFAAVDHDLVKSFAVAAKASGANHFIAISSVGAHVQSSNFYLQTKGQMEQSVADIGFDRADFVRPGLLRGDRSGLPRYGEQFGKLISPLTDMLLLGPLQRYRSVAAADVAAAICELAKTSKSGKFTHENREIGELAGAAG